MSAVAGLLGHVDTKMVEKHYGHLCPDFVADKLEKIMAPLDCVEQSNVVGLHDKAAAGSQ